MKSLILISGLILVLLTSCASTYNSSYMEVVLNSKPKGMSVLINDSLYGETPLIAKLRIQRNHQIKFKFKDSVVFTDRTYDSELDKYNTYFYFNLFKGNSNSNTSIDNLKPNDNESSEHFKENIMRKFSFDWSIILNNQLECEDLKLLNIENGQLKFTQKDTSEIDFKKYLTQKNQNSSIYSFPIDSIDKIVNYKKLSFSERLKNGMITLIIGSLIGYGLDNYILSNPNDQNNRYYSNKSSYGLAISGGFIGFIIGIIKSTKDYHKYKLNDMNTEERTQFINEEILLTDE